MEKAFLFHWRHRSAIGEAASGYTLVYGKTPEEACFKLDASINPTVNNYEIRLATLLPESKQEEPHLYQKK